MDVQETIERIREARKIVKEVEESSDNPQIRRCLHLADMNLHWAVWNLGEVDEIMPELEYQD